MSNKIVKITSKLISFVLSLVLSLFPSSILLINSIQAVTTQSFLQPQVQGKGVVYYTENYLRDYGGTNSKFNIPVPDGFIDEYAQYYISGADCSRYIDLTTKEINYFQELGLNFIILGFGPAAWYNIAPSKPVDPTYWNDSAYNFETLDRWIGMLQNAGLEPVLQLWGTPTWASGKSNPTATSFAPPNNVDAAYFGNFDKNLNAYTVIKGGDYWFRAKEEDRWSKDTLRDAFYSSPNASSVNVPTSDIGAAYYDFNGNYTVIKGDRYWYRTSPTSNWYTDTLHSAYYTSPNAAAVNVPTSFIDAAYPGSYDGNNSAYTVIKGDRYWFRSSNTANWSTDTLQSAYYTSSNALQIGVPTSGIDTAYYDFNGNYTVIKGDRYWYRTSPTSNWYTDTLYVAYYNQVDNCQANPYFYFEPYNVPPSQLTDFADFVKAIAVRYDGENVANPVGSGSLKVLNFSVWNEPNWGQFWSGSRSQFFNMHEQAYQALKSVRPDSIVWGMNMLGNAGDPAGFFRDMCSTKPSFDIFAYHPYPVNFNAPPENNSSYGYNISTIPQLINDLENCSGYENTPIALTEVGYRNNLESTQFDVDGVTISPQTKAQYLQESLDIINQANDGKIVAVANNTLHNAWRWWFTGLINIYPFLGTTTQALTEKDPAYSVFKNWQLTVLLPTPTPVPKAGDANGDGKVDGQDYIIWLNHYNQTTSNGPIDADFNEDGKVDGLDYVIWLNNYVG